MQVDCLAGVRLTGIVYDMYRYWRVPSGTDSERGCVVSQSDGVATSSNCAGPGCMRWINVADCVVSFAAACPFPKQIHAPPVADARPPPGPPPPGQPMLVPPPAQP